jgi:hypothetical protein
VYRTFVRTLFAVVACFALVFTAELAFEWWRLGEPGAAAMSWADINNPKLMDLMSPVARAYNNILAMLIATIGLAIPLTANMHTPKLIDMFLRDRLNQVVLFTMAFCAANVLWVAYIVGPEFAPMWAIRFAVFGALFGWALLIPYFFYVVRFLDPSNILARLRADVERALEDVAAGRLSADAGQTIAHERLYQIGTIVIKSLDRTDRDVALEGIWIIKLLLDHHGKIKQRMPAAWFEVDRADFVGLSREALELVSHERVFFERQALQQFALAYGHALSKVPDAVSSVSDATRVVAMAAAARDDGAALSLCIRYFNNYLRESVKAKHVHSIYDVFYQYRLLASDLAGRPGLVKEVAGHLAAYAAAARRAGITFITPVAAFDLGMVAIDAKRAKDPGADDVLARVLAIPHVNDRVPDPLVLEAKLKLGGALTKLGDDAGVSKVRDALAGTDDVALDHAQRSLIEAPRCFHEVTDRGEDLRWVPEADRAALAAFVASIPRS